MYQRKPKPSVVTRACKEAALLLACLNRKFGLMDTTWYPGILTSGNRSASTWRWSFRFQLEEQTALRSCGNLARANCDWKSKKSMTAITQNRVRKGLYFGGSRPVTRVGDAILLYGPSFL
jgi:hypothetical protein